MDLFLRLLQMGRPQKHDDVRFTTSNRHRKHHCSMHAQTDQKNNGTLSVLFRT